jgi:hypothetical protein
MDRFEIVGSRTDPRYLQVDIAYKNTHRELKALEALLEQFRDETSAKRSNVGYDDAQRYAFTKLLGQMLQFSDEGNFASSVTNRDRQRKLRAVARSVSEGLVDIVQVHKDRKVMTLTYQRPADPVAALRVMRKILRNA